MTDRTGAIEALLSQAEAAHGVYETTELGGIYDEAWAAWYAAYAVEHGIGDLVGRPLTADELEPLLVTAFAEFKGLDPRPTEPWSAWTARRIAAELKP
jgi:hypothetical protein